MRRARALIVAAALLAGCVPALRTPPPVREIGARGASGKGIAPAAPSSDATAHLGAPTELLAQAAVAFARRPDAAAVARARELYLAAARADESAVQGLLGAALAGAWLVEHETDRARRAALATESVQTCQWCVARAPDRIDCDYRLALALGQQARERPATAADALPRITALLSRVIAQAPELDEAGGHRVLALLLLRAPGWPAGPGDPELGLEHARAAVRLSPTYPPNLLALAEALAGQGIRDEARGTYEQARALARQRLAAGDPDAGEWIDQVARAEAALR